MLHNFKTIAIPLLLALIPLIFWTITPNFFGTAKLFLFLTYTLALVIIYLSGLVSSKVLVLPKNSLVLPLVLFFFSIIISLVVSPEGRPEALSGKGLLLLALPLSSWVLLTQSHTQTLEKLLKFALTSSSAILALYTLFQLTLIPNLSFVPSFLQTKTFTPTGDYLSTLLFLLIGTLIAFYDLPKANQKTKIFNLVSIILSVISSVAIISLMLPGSLLALQLIPYEETWAITLDALKTTRSLLFGVGISNYSLLYTVVKPLTLNATNLWNILPQTGTSELLTIFATTGIIGGLSLIAIFVQGLRTTYSSYLFYPTLLLVIALILTPGNIILYVLFFTLITLAPHSTTSHHELTTQKSFIFGLSGIALALFLYGYSMRSFIAEYYVGQAQAGLKNNDGKMVYDYQKKALDLTPNITKYHLSFAEINLNLAGALSQKQTLDDQEKNTVSQLIQQAINESKLAIGLQPNNTLTWLSLGKIYRNLIGVAAGSETFTVDNYAKAVALDPSNPALRLDFGSVFYQLATTTQDEKERVSFYSRAITELQMAIQLKPDYTNAYYNLAKVYESAKDYDNAYLNMQKTLTYLGSNNSEFGRISTELEAIKSKLKTPPQTSPDTIPDNQLEITQ
ncbi:tetratricopeptide repeat protein [Candidatus Woesebacteria bacterium]|nr:tetratricopeptide repeat protein [Candidatus Woesebacteria bacterium]